MIFGDFLAAAFFMLLLNLDCSCSGLSSNWFHSWVSLSPSTWANDALLSFLSIVSETGVFTASFLATAGFVAAFSADFFAILSNFFAFSSFLASSFFSSGAAGVGAASAGFSSFSASSAGAADFSLFFSFVSFLSKPDEKKESILTIFFKKPHLAYSSALRAS